MKRLILATLILFTIFSCAEEEPEYQIENIVGRWVLDNGQPYPSLDLLGNKTYELQINNTALGKVKGAYTYSNYILTLKTSEDDVIYGVTFRSNDEIVLDEISKTEFPDNLTLVRD